jgi:hypothetical protein
MNTTPKIMANIKIHQYKSLKCDTHLKGSTYEETRKRKIDN